MKRSRLKELARDKRFIPGIYNYCDRWCERCPQTQRCLNFASVEQDVSDPDALDIRNAAFWKKVSDTFAEAVDLLKESAEEWGIDIETPPTPEEVEKEKRKDRKVEDHLLSRVARSYAERVQDWFAGKESLLVGLGSTGAPVIDLDEVFEVIRWYQFFIAAKVMRALHGAIPAEAEQLGDEFLSDSDGSAKIALIAIDRSIAAWAALRICEGEEAHRMISLLDQLRQAVELTFPKARSFLRPGFDDPESGT